MTTRKVHGTVEAGKAARDKVAAKAKGRKRAKQHRYTARENEWILSRYLKCRGKIGKVTPLWERFRKKFKAKVGLRSFRQQCSRLYLRFRRQNPSVMVAARTTATRRKQAIKALPKAKNVKHHYSLPAPAEKPALPRLVQVTITAEGVDVHEDGKGRHTTMKKLTVFIVGH